MSTVAPLCVIGAGPFGLAVAAGAVQHGIAVTVLGTPMEFWRRQMPAGMILRSASDWHLDPQSVHTIEAFLAARGQRPADVEPLRLPLYLEYAAWFQQRAGVEVTPAVVRRLDVLPSGGFQITHDDGQVVADQVVVAVGLNRFAYVPPELAALIPARRLHHTAEFVDMAAGKGQRCLIIGGRQSAFEWAALLHEAGATSVDIVHRHPSPAFAVANWDWATQLAQRYDADPGWYRRLPQHEKDAISSRMWGEGRLKVEPWLEERLADSSVRVWPNRSVVSCIENGELLVGLDRGEELVADIALAATGYVPDVARIPFLAAGNVLGRLATTDGMPTLDDTFQSTVPRLYIVGALAAAGFGPFFGFTLVARHAAAIVGRAVRQAVQQRSPVR